MFSHVQGLFPYQRGQMKTDNCPLTYFMPHTFSLLPLVEDAFGYEGLLSKGPLGEMFSLRI